MESELGRYSKVAALSVSVASATFVLAVLILIIVMGMLQSSPMNTDFVQSLIASCSENVNHCNVAMELIIQETRGSRAGLALYYRFAISATAIVVALSMVVLGSVLIFDRITSASHPLPAEPGEYTLSVDTGGPLPHCEEQAVTIPDMVVPAEIHCDTGIR